MDDRCWDEPAQIDLLEWPLALCDYGIDKIIGKLIPPQGIDVQRYPWAPKIGPHIRGASLAEHVIYSTSTCTCYCTAVLAVLKLQYLSKFLKQQG